MRKQLQDFTRPLRWQVSNRTGKARVQDRTFIYTAVTRAQVQVILVEDVEAVRKAIALPPHASSRQVLLAEMIEG